MSIFGDPVRRTGKGADTKSAQDFWEPIMPTIAPFLWFDHQAEEAMNFYVSIFKNSKVISIARAGEKVMSVQFEVEGQKGDGHERWSDVHLQ